MCNKHYRNNQPQIAADLPRESSGILARFSDAGGYPLYYVTDSNNALCPACADRIESHIRHDSATIAADPDSGDLWHEYESVTRAEINYEDSYLYCDQCSTRIESAYGDDSDESSE